MRLSTSLSRFSGTFFVILLLVTQSFLPLIHGHGGYDEPVAGFHMPGLEKLVRSGGAFDQGYSNGFYYPEIDLIVSVSSGIETKKYLKALELDLPALLGALCLVLLCIPRLAYQSREYPDFLPASGFLWSPLSPRAPPLH